MANSPSKNGSVEEILASIRQAISADDAKRTLERHRNDARATAADKGPVANVTDVYGEDAETGEAEPVDDGDEVDVSPDQDVIEQAIEQALNGVRAELEGRRPTSRLGRTARMNDATSADSIAAQRAIPRARIAGTRREMVSPRRALLSGRAETQVSSSFDELAQAMITGNAAKLDRAVEEVLRPMLKTWLEGNLPQIVERLVRDEIERVSRGRK